MRKLPFIITIITISILYSCNPKPEKKSNENSNHQIKEKIVEKVDTNAYNNKLEALANGDTTGLWPVESRIYPLGGAILPFKRIVAYYGNLYSKIGHL